jgi:predicted nucleic acid-binding protein
MKVLIDTNVALDILLKRKDYAVAISVFGFAEKNIFSGYITPEQFMQLFAKEDENH